MLLFSRSILCSLVFSFVAFAAIPPAAEEKVAALPLAGGKPGPADKDSEIETIPDALKKAVALASLVEDGEFQSRLKRDLVEFHLANDLPEAAVKLAESIPDYRRGIALAQVAAALARRGDKERIEPVLDRAMSQTGLPQDEAIRAEAAIAWAAAGNEERGATIAAKFVDQSAQFRAKSGMAVERARRGESYDSAIFDAPQDINKLAPELLMLARGAIEIAEIRLAAAKDDKDSVAALCRQSESIIRACKATAGEELLDTGILWRKIGDMKKSAEVLGLALRHLPPGVEMQGWRAGYFARMVGLYVEAGEEERVASMLALGRKGITPLHAFHQPPALCQLAEAELVAGLPEKAEKTWAEAVAVALANPNPSSSYLGSAQVAFSIARTRRAVPDSVAAMLDSLIRGEKAAPPADK